MSIKLYSISNQYARPYRVYGSHNQLSFLNIVEVHQQFLVFSYSALHYECYKPKFFSYSPVTQKISLIYGRLRPAWTFVWDNRPPILAALPTSYYYLITKLKMTFRVCVGYNLKDLSDNKPLKHVKIAESHANISQFIKRHHDLTEQVSIE